MHTQRMAQKKSGKGGGLSDAQKVGIGVGLTATALAAVGGYFFYGSKDAAQNRKKAKSWMLKAKAEVLEGLESAKTMTQEEYEALVQNVVKGYKTAKGASTRELMDFARDMRAHWKDIERATAKKTAKTATKVAKRASKKATKKAAGKRAKN